MSRIYAGVLGTLAMAVVICRGLIDASGAQSTLASATLWMIVLALVGSILGHLAQTTVDESVRTRLEREMASRGQPPAAS